MSDDGSLAQPKDTYSGTAKVSYEGNGEFMSTPSDSAMTAERLIEEDLQSLSDWDRSSNWQREIYDRAIRHIAALSAERTKLAADLARVEGEVHKWRGAYNNSLYRTETAESRALAAEAKSARLEEALEEISDEPDATVAGLKAIARRAIAAAFSERAP